ncbi:MAG: hypothetical protein Q8P67_23525 [archaeon]|nr:hypothetical protein [archaeon]
MSKLVESPKNKFESNQNHDLAIEAARKLGCSVVNIGGEDLLKGTPHLVMGLLWQIIKKALMSQVTSQMDFSRLAGEGESEADMSGIPPEQILLRWFNFHLKNAGSHRVVTNFTSDLSDAELYLHLLHQLAPEKVSIQALEAGLRETDPLVKASLVIQWAELLGCRKFITAKAILDGNPNLNLAFVATLFSAYPTLGPTAEEKAVKRVVELESDLFDLESLLGDSRQAEQKFKAALDTVQEEKVTLEESLKETTEKLQKLVSNNEELIVHKQKLEAKVQDLETEKDEFKTQLETALEEKDDLFEQLTRELGLKEEVEKKYTETKSEFEALRQKAQEDELEFMAKLEAEVGAKEELEAELTAVKTVLSETQEQVVKAQRDTEELLQELSKEMEEKATVSFELQRNQALLEKTISESRAQQNELLDKLESTIEDWENEKIKHEEVEATLTQQLESEKGARKVVEKKLADKEAELERTISESDNETLALLARIQQLEEELAATKKAMADALAKAAIDQETALRTAQEAKDKALAEAEAAKDAALEKVRALLSGSERSGWLQFLSKNMAGLPKWKKRYFVLKDGFLTFYKSEKEIAKQKPLGMIDCETTRLYEMEEEDSKKPFAFQIDSGNSQFNVAATSSNERSDWMTEIRVAKKKKLGVKVVGDESKEGQRKASQRSSMAPSKSSGAISPR